MTKKCKVCGKVKELSEFYRNRKYIDGHINMCKECRKIQNIRYYNKHSDQINQTDISQGHRVRCSGLASTGDS